MDSKIKLACFDFDNTLVDFSPHYSSWDFLHSGLGVFEESQKLKKQYFEGKFNFAEWAVKDLELWRAKGATREILTRIIRKAKPMPRVLETLEKLRSKGLKLAVVSGGLDFVYEAFFPERIFDVIEICKAVFASDGLIERVEAHKVEDKLSQVKRISASFGLSLNEVAFVGDHYNDVEVVSKVGLGIAFNPGHSGLEEKAKVVIREKDFSKLLDFL
ncbi:MAG TPA: HAD-IB family phosphatase [Candidatus Diapherotrites archaeon]|uniref:phosphoserine phosphatase n=1 Tax=Candidatus Iainarchaeum sp. TaxID=3101447 RepID=A0A7J4K1I4_9ARCH|nr:HAD-IB family phosphatase [Candidatus Diapherotrites archaeon]